MMMMASTRKPRRAAICAVSESSDDVGIATLRKRRRGMIGGGVGLHLLLLTSLFSLISIQSVKGQLSYPVAKDSDVEDENNKFQQRRPSLDRQPIPKADEAKFEKRSCPHNLHLRWTTEVSSSVYATPLIADINNDGRQEIVVPTFVHYVEVLDGSDGEKVAGWPAYHRSTAHASPLLYDIDSDGIREIVMATYDGEIMFIKPNGEVMSESIMIPRLRVKKDWYVGLAEDPVDHSKPDIGEPDLDALKFEGFGANDSHGSIHVNKEKASNHKDIEKAVNAAVDAMKSPQQAQAEATGAPKVGVEASAAPVSVSVPVSAPVNADQPVVNQQADSAQAQAGMSVLNNAVKREHPAGADPHLVDVEGIKREGEKEGASQGVQQGQAAGHNQQGASGDVAHMRRRSLLEAASEDKAGADQIPGAENMEGLDEDGTSSFDVFKDGEEEEEGTETNDPGLEDEYRYDYDEALNNDVWGEEGFEEAKHIQEANEVEVDAHVLCTPVIADIDNDGVDELVVAVSYFFDREYYDDSEHRQELGKDIEPGNYVAGGIAVFDLQTKKRKWHVHLDLTTDRTSYRAYIYSSPTVIDLDDDGRLEVIVGTGLGYIYMLNADGMNRENSPLQMGEIQGQVVAADVNDDGLIELVACDTRGSVAVINWRGQILWETHVHSLISQGATVGDVDGDGSTDIVFGTASGHIYAVNGKDGKNLTHFPFRTHGRIMAPILLTNLRGSGRVHLVVLGFDGYLYTIDGVSGCADTLDIGETSYSMVLTDNVDGGNDMELLVTTMSGNVYCFETSRKHNPLMSWQSQSQGRNVHFNRYQSTGIFFLDERHRDVTGSMLTLRYKIVDATASVHTTSRTVGQKHEIKTTPKYDVELYIYGLGKQPQRHRFSHHAPGVYQKTILAPSARAYATYRLEMRDRHQHLYYDEILISFHVHIYRILKWVLVVPLVFMVLALILRQQADQEAPLPSFRRGHLL